MSSSSSLKLLNALSIRLQGLLDSENFHQSILNLLKSELSYEGIQFWSLPSGVSADARLDAVVGREEGLVELGQALSPRDSVLAYVFQKKESLLLETIPHEVKASSPIVSERTRSLLATPVLRGSDLLGILVVESAKEKGFAENDVLFFEALAAQMATVAKSRELLMDAKAFNKKLQSAVQEKTLELRRAHERILDQQKDLQKENKALKTLVEAESRGQEFVGESAATREIRLFPRSARIASTIVTV